MSTLTILFVLIVSELFNGDEFFNKKNTTVEDEKEKRIDQIIEELTLLKR